MKSIKPCNYHLELCFKCSCGCTHWVEARHLKSQKFIECWCGKKTRIEQTKYQVVTVSQGKVDNTSSKRFKLVQFLKNQGYSKHEISKMISNLDWNASLTWLTKQALANYQTNEQATTAKIG